jgi:hypothetical protein
MIFLARAIAKGLATIPFPSEIQAVSDFPYRQLSGIRQFGKKFPLPVLYLAAEEAQLLTPLVRQALFLVNQEP